MQHYSEKLDRLIPFFALFSSLGILAAVFYTASESNNYWSYNVGIDAAYWVIICMLGAGFLRHFVPVQAAAYFTAAMVLYMAPGVGLAQSAATAVFILSCYLYGRIALGFMFPGQKPDSGTQCVVVGMAGYLAVFGVMIHFPVSYRSVYFAIVLAPVAVLIGSGKQFGLWSDLRNNLGVCARATSLPYWFVVLTIILLSLVCRFGFVPTMHYDDLALHLGMWQQLSDRQVYGFDVVKQVWEVEPFAVDLLHAIVSILASEDARPALNLFFLTFLLRQLWVILGHFPLRDIDRGLLLLLFISTPLTGSQLLTLQTELFMALLVASGVRLVLEAGEGWYSRNFLAILSVAAICSATKLPGVWIGALLTLAAFAKLWLSRPGTPHNVTLGRGTLVAGFVGLLGIVAFNSYFTAWWITGNPLFPFYNGIFESPYLPAANITDTRWIQGFSLVTYLKVFFSTSDFFESFDFVAGFQYLFLLPLGVIALLRRTPRVTAMIVLLPLFGFGLVMFFITQYWRYMFPIFPLAIVVIGSLLLNLPARQTGAFLCARLALILCMALNFYFYPGSSWMMNFPPSSAYTQNERLKLIEALAPVRALNTYLNEYAPGMTVLYPDEDPFGATLNGHPVYVTWVAPATLAKFVLIKTEADVATFLQAEEVDFVITFNGGDNTPGTAKWALREYLSHAGFPELKMGEYILYRVLDHDITYEQVYTLPGTGIAEAGPAAETHDPPREDVSTAAQGDARTSETPVKLASISMGAGKSARLRVALSCVMDAGYINVEINWHIGANYYRLIPCANGVVNFTEAFPVPAGASAAEISVGMRNIPDVTLSGLTLEIN